MLEVINLTTKLFSKPVPLKSGSVSKWLRAGVACVVDAEPIGRIVDRNDEASPPNLEYQQGAYTAGGQSQDLRRSANGSSPPFCPFIGTLQSCSTCPDLITPELTN